MKTFWRRTLVKIKKWLGLNIFLCDSCQWNWRSACHNRLRPNVTECSEYRQRGK